MTGSSRLQLPHHSAQKTTYTGFCSALSAKVDPSASASSKSGAGGPSNDGAGSAAGIREGLLFAMKKEVLNNYLLSLSAAMVASEVLV